MTSAQRNPEYTVVVHGIARSKYARSAPKYEENVRQSAALVFDAPLTERGLSVSLRHFYTTGHRVDLDNLLKSVLDGLKGAAYEDDSQIDEVSARRYNMFEGFGRIDLRPGEAQLVAALRDFVVITVSYLQQSAPSAG